MTIQSTSEKGVFAALRKKYGFDHRFVFWTLLEIAGFAYVAAVFCHRDNPLLSRQHTYLEIIKLLAVTPVLYYLGPRNNLKSFAEPLRDVLRWNGLGYVLPFFISLHFFYLQSFKKINYSLRADELSRMPPIGVAVFLCCALLIVALALYHFRLAYREKILLPYLGSFFGVIALLAGVSWGISDRYYVHIHHYFLFAFFIPFARFKDPVSLVCQALSTAIYVEGVSEWGMATLWYLHR